MFPVAYWKTSTLVSNLVTSLYFKSCGSQMCLSLSTRCNSSFGGASTSVDTRQRRSGCPSPTFLYAISTLLSAGLLTVTQPRLLLERITIFNSAHYKSSVNLFILLFYYLLFCYFITVYFITCLILIRYIVFFSIFLSFIFVYIKIYNFDLKIFNRFHYFFHKRIKS